MNKIGVVQLPVNERIDSNVPEYFQKFDVDGVWRYVQDVKLATRYTLQEFAQIFDRNGSSTLLWNAI